jgi:hypothetical protein
MTTAQARRAISAQFSTDLLLVFIGLSKMMWDYIILIAGLTSGCDMTTDD